jgi:catalase (peroxidase I)
VLKWDAEFAANAQEYAADNAEFKKVFAGAWTKVMNADRFKGPEGNVCA